LGRFFLRQLDISNGCQNHTTSPYAHTPFVCALSDRSQANLPCGQIFRANAAASIASHPAFVTTRDPPLWWGETGKLIELICPTAKAKYFCAAHLDRWNRLEVTAKYPPDAQCKIRDRGRRLKRSAGGNRTSAQGGLFRRYAPGL
jgi:hypothetical protein